MHEDAHPNLEIHVGLSTWYFLTIEVDRPSRWAGATPETNGDMMCYSLDL